MSSITNYLDTLRQAHCDNARQVYYAMGRGRQRRSTMPVTSFVFEYFIYNSLYQYDWERSIAEADMVPWEDEPTEPQQQNGLERFVKSQCKSNPQILMRAFEPLTHIDDLTGEWTEVTPCAGTRGITTEDGRRFFRKLTQLRDRVRSRDDLKINKSLFDLICDCRYFVNRIRNAVFHGSKSIGETWDAKQRKRIEVYDIFLKCLVSLFFLAVDDEKPVASDSVQVPIRVPRGNEMFHTIEQRRISEAVINRAMKPEDSRLIREFFCQADEPPQSPGSRDALFYPSSGKDILTPLLLGLPFCSQFFFYDRFIKRNGQMFENQIKKYLGPRSTIERSMEGDDTEVVTFDFWGIPRSLHLVSNDNREFLRQDVDLTFYFHRGDSPGEGGSDQKWDSFELSNLGQQVEDTGICQIVTDGEPGGLHPDVKSQMRTLRIPESERGRDYFLGRASRHLLSEIRQIEPDK